MRDKNKGNFSVQEVIYCTNPYTIMGAFDARKEFYEELLRRTADSLRRRGWKARIIEDCGEIIGEIGGKTVGVPGSITVRECGLMEKLRENFRVVEHWESSGKREDEVRCDVFVHSANAVSVDGYVVICDYFGNRIAGSSMGPKQLILIIGVNKITMSLYEAIERARFVAATINAKRLGKKAEDIRAFTLIIEKAPPTMDCRAYLLNKVLGY